MLLSSNERKNDSGSAEDVALFLAEDKTAEDVQKAGTQLWNIRNANQALEAYQIIDNTGDGIVVSPASGTVKKGGEQFFIVSTEAGYEILNIFVNGEPVNLNGSKFKVSGISSDLVITAEVGMVDSETCYIINKESQKLLCLPGNSTKEGEGILEWGKENSKNFYWSFTETAKDSGIYTLKNLNSQKVISVKDSSKEDGAGAIQTGNEEIDASKWILKEEELGYYSITNVNSRLALTRGADGYAVQSAYSGADNQLWALDYVIERD